MPTDATIEFLDHTGDAGFVVTAPSLVDLFVACAEAMTRLRAPDAEVGAVVTREVRAFGWDLAELLVNWLAEIHGDGEAYREIYGGFAIDEIVADLGDCRIVGRTTGERLDPARHRLACEIKAVTHHQAWVREENGSWRGQIIFDL